MIVLTISQLPYYPVFGRAFLMISRLAKNVFDVKHFSSLRTEGIFSPSIKSMGLCWRCLGKSVDENRGLSIYCQTLERKVIVISRERHLTFHPARDNGMMCSVIM